MRYRWTLAAVLSTALVAGCSDPVAENTENPAENALAPAAGAPGAEATAVTPAPSLREDGGAVRDNRVSSANTPAAAAPRPAAPRVELREVTAPAGTALPLELLTAVSSETAQVETPVRARLRNAVAIDGREVLPAGAVFYGNVTQVERAGRVRGLSHLAFRFTEVEIDGARETLRTNPLSFEGEETKGEDATKIGAGAVGGAIIGGILGGGDGAAKGAAIGGAAGTGAVLATRGKEIALASGTSLSASLAEPFSVRVRE